MRREGIKSFSIIENDTVSCFAVAHGGVPVAKDGRVLHAEGLSFSAELAVKDTLLNRHGGVADQRGACLMLLLAIALSC